VKQSSAILVAILLLPVLLTGCRTNFYIVPLPIIKEYQDAVPINCGFLMTRELRDQWWDNQPASPRIDVPIGKVVLDFAAANFKNAFHRPGTPDNPEGIDPTLRDFYTIRYADRRSSRGLLIKLEAIDFDVDDKTANCTLSITLEDAAGRRIYDRSYAAQGTPAEGAGLLQKTLYGDSSVELSTAAAMNQIFQNMLADIRALVEQQGG